MKLIVPGQIAFKATITEEELRQRMGDEVLAQVGGLDENGKRHHGLTVKVTRGDSRTVLPAGRLGSVTHVSTSRIEINFDACECCGVKPRLILKGVANRSCIEFIEEVAA